MAAQQFKLPLIDFTKLEQQGFVHDSPEWINVRDQVSLALQEVGTFEAVFGETVPVEARESVIGLLRDAFDLPLESMDGINDLCDKMFFGYLKLKKNDTIYQSFGVDGIELDEGVERLCKCLWPQGEPPHSRVNIHTYADKITQVEQLIRKMVLESLGCEKYLKEQQDNLCYHFRCSKYDANGAGDNKVVLRPHRDQNFLTVLYQNGIDGLEIQTDDGEWHPVHQQPNSFVVFAGDSFHAWSNGRLRTQMHRVNMRGSEMRYSIGMFSMPKPGNIVSAPAELVDEEHPLLYRPYAIQEYFNHCKTSHEEFRLKTFRIA